MAVYKKVWPKSLPLRTAWPNLLVMPEEYKAMTAKSINKLLILSIALGLYPIHAHGKPACEAGKAGDLLCKDAEVIKLDKELNLAWKNAPCTREQKDSFVPEQLFWLRQRNFCNNEDDTRSCVIGETSKRIKFLTSLKACDTASRSMKYAFTDAWYVLKNPNLYINTEADILGSVKPDSCQPSSTSTSGILASGRQGDKEMKVVFKSLPAQERSFLCHKQPYSHWRGTIKKGANGVYLYLADILGNPLP